MDSSSFQGGFEIKGPVKNGSYLLAIELVLVIKLRHTLTIIIIVVKALLLILR
jgi:hypothetical protein